MSFYEQSEGEGGRYIFADLEKLFLLSDRFWKKAGYTPVYLRQTPVSKKKNPNFFVCVSAHFAIML